MDKSAEAVLKFNDPEAWYLFTADGQTAGRGTKDRKWESPTGFNILATYVFALHQKDIHLSSHMSQVTGVSVAQTIKSYGLDPKFKWVNDVLLGRRKIGGILTKFSNSINLKGFYIFEVGIGVNINMPQELLDAVGQPATSLLAYTGKVFDRNLFLNLLTHNLYRNVFLLLEEGFTPFLEEINKNLAFVGEQIVVEGSGSDNERLSGVLVGLNESGNMLLKTAEDKIETLCTGTIVKDKLEQKESDENAMPVLHEEDVLRQIVNNRNFVHRHFDSVTSIMDISAKEAAQYNKSQWTLITADEETKREEIQGGERSSSLPKDNIYATLVLPVHSEIVNSNNNFDLNLRQVVGLSISQALETHGFKPQIKWVSSILLNNNKLGDILYVRSESRKVKDTQILEVGIRLNVNVKPYLLDNRDKLTSMAAEKEESFDRNLVLNNLLNILEDNLNYGFEKGFASLLSQVNARLANKDQMVTVTPFDSTENTQSVTGLMLGIDQEGLLLIDVNGSIHKFDNIACVVEPALPLAEDNREIIFSQFRQKEDDPSEATAEATPDVDVSGSRSAFAI